MKLYALAASKTKSMAKPAQVFYCRHSLNAATLYAY